MPFIGWRLIGISGSLIWSKTLMEQIFNPYCEFRWSLEGPVSQIHSPHLHVGAPGILSDLLRSIQMIKREWGAESNGNYRTYPSLVELQPEFLSLRWKTCLWAELQPWFMSLQWMTCPWAEYSWWWFYILFRILSSHVGCGLPRSLRLSGFNFKLLYLVSCPSFSLHICTILAAFPLFSEQRHFPF